MLCYMWAHSKCYAASRTTRRIICCVADCIISHMLCVGSYQELCWTPQTLYDNPFLDTNLKIRRPPLLRKAIALGVFRNGAASRGQTPRSSIYRSTYTVLSRMLVAEASGKPWANSPSRSSCKRSTRMGGADGDGISYHIASYHTIPHHIIPYNGSAIWYNILFSITKYHMRLIM